MFDEKLHDYCSEFYTVEKSIEVVVDRAGVSTPVKIDALRNEQTGKYTTHVYLREHVTLQPTYPQAYGQYERKPDDFIIWVNWVDFPWTERDSADAVLRQALGFLRERCTVPARR